MPRVEYLKAHERGTWSTEVFDVPDGTSDLVRYAVEELGVQAQYRNIVLWAVYAILPDEEFLAPCCERDYDGDGNCDRHPNGVRKSTSA